MQQTPRTAPATALVSSLALGIFTLLLSPAQAGEIYKWVNDNNEIQYTQVRPPVGVEVEVLKTRSGPSPAAAEPVARATPAPATAASEPGASTGGETAATDEGERSSSDIARTMQENCLKARSNLDVLNRGGNVQYRTSSGEIIRLSEEQRQQRIAEANEQIRLLCKG